MDASHVRAVTFDLWNTLVVEGASGLFHPRVRAWQQELRASGIDVHDGDLEAAHRAALEAYQRAWLANTQFCSAEATTEVLERLGLRLDDPARERLTATFHAAGLDSEILPTPNSLDAVASLKAAGVRTAIICDIGLTPSSALLVHLERLHLLELIDVFTWSDELGVYKPHADAFATTLNALDVPAEAAVHVGDRRRTDVQGARDAGMSTVRYRFVYDDAEALPEADHVIDDLMDLLAIIGVESPH
jgi:putative hydrolase of the HAD superfamily